MCKKSLCRLCEKEFKDSEMSEEHYPAKSTGNNDIVAFDFLKMYDFIQSGEISVYLQNAMKRGKTKQEALDEYFDQELAKPLYPNGRTARTLCQKCNTFLGKYDEAYLKFYNAKGDPNIVKGYQEETKIQIVKSIFGFETTSLGSAAMNPLRQLMRTAW